MKLLIVDPNGEGLDIAMRAARDGHQVRHFIRDMPKSTHIGHGVSQVVREYQPWVRWADLVLMTDNTKYLAEFDQKWRKEGVKVIGPTEAAAKWEVDRAVGMAIFDKCDIDIPPYRMFNDYDKAIAYVKREKRRFVSKPCGDDNKALSYVSKSPEDMIYMLQRWKKMDKLKGSFIMQEFMPGIEMAVGGWFGPGGFNVGWCENFEFKKLMNDDMGVATGEQGTVLRYVRNSKLARKVLAPLEAELEKLGYVGYIDVNCIISDDGTPWPLEFTMRPGWPTFNIQQALHEGDSVQWLLDLASGTDTRNFTLNSVATGVVVSIPDYPYSRLTGKEVTGVPVYGIEGELMKHVHPCQMMMGMAPRMVKDQFYDMPMLVTAGDYVLVMTATAPTVRASSALTYRRLKELTVPNSPMYRTDIGKRLKKQLPLLQAMGYATGLEF